MPLALAIIAWVLVMTGIRGNYANVGKQFEADVVGNPPATSGSFLGFLVGIIGIAVFFRLIGAPEAGKVFLGLVLLVFLMQNANVFSALSSATSGSSTAVTTSATTGTAASNKTTSTTTSATP